MIEIVGIIPHPAFDSSLLPDAKGRRLLEQRGGEQHYPQSYLQSITTPSTNIDAVSVVVVACLCSASYTYVLSLLSLHSHLHLQTQARDVLGYVVYVVTSVYSLLMAWFFPFWIVDSSHLNLIAWMESPREAIFLRRMIIISVS